jgi:predicted metal-dependent hydrolase
MTLSPATASLTTLAASVPHLKLVRNPRAKVLRLMVSPATGEAVLTMPPRVAQSEVLAFWHKHEPWVQRQRAKIAPARPFAVGEVIPLFGQEVILAHEPTHRGRGTLTADRLVVGGQPAFFARRVEDFIKNEAQKRFRDEAQIYANQLEVRIARLVVKDTQSRWGSCSSAGQINLSWRLAFAPPWVASYVVAHEVAHLVEMNHSSRFWAQVDKLVGKPTRPRQWLKSFGPSLLRIGVAGVPQEAVFVD